MKKILFRQGAGYLINGRIDVSLYPTEEQDRENLEIDSRDFRHLELRSTDKLLLHTKTRNHYQNKRRRQAGIVQSIHALEAN